MRAATSPAKRSHKTYERLILVAERLFAERGIESVSMRQIGEVAELANNTVVQYHFGDKASLVRAIYENRQPFLLTRRRQLLKQAQQENRLSPRDLLEVMLRPHVEIVDENGRHMYARFIWQLHRPDTMQIFQVPPLASRQEETAILLHAALDHLPTPLFDVRLRAAVSMFLYMLMYCDSEPWNRDERAKEVLIKDSLDAATAALSVPYTKP